MLTVCTRLTQLYLFVEYKVENTLYSTNKYSCVRRVHTLYISYCSLKHRVPFRTYKVGAVYLSNVVEEGLPHDNIWTAGQIFFPSQTSFPCVQFLILFFS